MFTFPKTNYFRKSYISPKNTITMKSASLAQLEKELRQLEAQELVQLCLKLAKYKKENKELLNFLLFESTNKENYLERIKEELENSFYEINRKSAYTTKKGLQKVVRLMTKHIKQNASLTAELDLRIWFCKKVRHARIDLDMDQVISNLYYREISKIQAVLQKLHEDQREDYRDAMQSLHIVLE